MCTLGAVKPFALSLIYIIYTIAVNLTHTKTYFSYLSERTKKKKIVQYESNCHQVGR